MSLTKKCVETLVDLVDNKLTSMQVFDRDDAREMQILEVCKRELEALIAPRRAAMVSFAGKAEALGHGRRVAV